jgi:DNA repair exonuclease SbcCD ATPase subunit
LLNIFDNHHGRIKKKDLEKILDSLEDEKAIIGKLYGKAKIYFYNQAHHPQLDPEKMEKVKADMEALRLDLQAKTNKLKDLKGEVSKFDRTQSIESLKAEVASLEQAVDDLNTKLKKYKTMDVELVPEDVIKKIEQERDKLQIEFKKRTKMLKDIIDTICEGSEMKPEKVRKMMHLE